MTTPSPAPVPSPATVPPTPATTPATTLPPLTLRLDGPDADLAAANAELEAAATAEPAFAEALVRRVLEAFPGQVFLTTAWQRNGMVLVEMISRLAPDTPVLFVDTGYHFPETLEYSAEMTRRFGLNLITCRPLKTREAFEAEFGARLHDRDPDTCCKHNKVEPLDREIARLGRRVWLTALRRDQSETRGATPILQRRKDGLLKVAPMVKWTNQKVWQYLKARGIPDHPLYDKGYASIGCAPESCTRPVAPGDDERAGRWAGKGKKECGLHV
jgi:phosphoadenosine phosphosulfate reductase